jgi:hypothetical protein
MHERRRLAVTGGRLALLVLAVATGWGAIVSAGGGHAVGAQLVGAPAVASEADPASRPAPSVLARPAAVQRPVTPPRSLIAQRSPRMLPASRDLARTTRGLRRTPTRAR